MNFLSFNLEDIRKSEEIRKWSKYHLRQGSFNMLESHPSKCNSKTSVCGDSLEGFSQFKRYSKLPFYDETLWFPCQKQNPYERYDMRIRWLGNTDMSLMEELAGNKHMLYQLHEEIVSAFRLYIIYCYCWFCFYLVIREGKQVHLCTQGN